MSDNKVIEVDEPIETYEQQLERLGVDIPLEDMKKWYDFTKAELVAAACALDDYDATIIENTVGHCVYLRRKENPGILAVCHIDTVVAHNKGAYTLDVVESNIEGQSIHILRSPHNDDRLGVAIIFEMLAQHDVLCDVLICDMEEVGQTTSRQFMTWRTGVPDKEKGEGSRLRDYNWFVEFDRGGADVALYQYGRGTSDEVKAWKAALSEFWPAKDLSSGSFTDICTMGDMGVMALNVGVGYRDPHSTTGNYILEHLAYGFQNFLGLYEKYKGTKFVFTEPAPLASSTSKWSATPVATEKWAKMARNIVLASSPKGIVFSMLRPEKMRSCYAFPDKEAQWEGSIGTTTLSTQALIYLFNYYNVECLASKCETCNTEIRSSLKGVTICNECAEEERKKKQLALPAPTKPKRDYSTTDDAASFMTKRENVTCNGCGGHIGELDYNCAIVKESQTKTVIFCSSCLDEFVGKYQSPEKAMEKVLAGTCLTCLRRCTSEHLLVIPNPSATLDMTDMVCVECAHTTAGKEGKPPYVQQWVMQRGFVTTTLANTGVLIGEGALQNLFRQVYKQGV